MTKTIIKILGLLLLLTACFAIKAESAAPNSVAVIAIKGPIGPAIADYVKRGIENNQGKSFILLTIDTPGGLDTSTRVIVKSILASSIPVVGFVSPKGARAASAGTFILYACHLAAMAPGTQLGAASPVNMAAGFSKQKTNSTMKNKVTNDAIATIKTLAELHGRDTEFAIAAVKSAATLTAKQALKQGVINFIAFNQKDLVKQLNGQSVTINHQTHTLETSNSALKSIKQDWRNRFLAVITSPTVAYLLLMLGIYGIFFELASPGFVLPGVIGAIAIVIALYALHLLPISYAGLCLILLGIVFMIAEAFVPSFGALGIGGVIAFLIGSFLLIDSPIESLQIAKSIIFGVTIANALFFLVVTQMILRSRHAQPQNDIHHLIGQTGIVLNLIDNFGQAKINGEIWQISTNASLKPHEKIKIIDVQGLLLIVEKTSHKE